MKTPFKVINDFTDCAPGSFSFSIQVERKGDYLAAGYVKPAALRELIEMLQDVDIKYSAGQDGQGVGAVVHLEKLVPVGANDAATQNIGAPVVAIDAKALKHAKFSEFFSHMLGLYRAITNDESVKLSDLVQDANGFIVEKPVLPISGVLRCDGKYFFVDGGHFYALDDFGSHVFTPGESELSTVYRLAAKYVFKDKAA